MFYYANRKMDWDNVHFVDPGDEVPAPVKPSLISARRVIEVKSRDEIPGKLWADRLAEHAAKIETDGFFFPEAVAEAQPEVAGSAGGESGSPAALEAPAPPALPKMPEMVPPEVEIDLESGPFGPDADEVPTTTTTATTETSKAAKKKTRKGARRRRG